MERGKLIASVLSALSSQIRVDVLKLLNRKGNASFTEIMQALGLNIRTEAGKFAYHLRELTGAELVVGSSSKGYSLTSLGERVVDFVYILEETALKRSAEMFVRTSRYSIETFERKKIAKSLINEAGVPEEQAENISKEVEERLLKMKVRYLTAPLIREFVNAILIEKGMEDYRHTLTRLGLPVYDVTELIEKQPGSFPNTPETIHGRSGDAVLEQYMLLKALPRRVSDAHLSGSIYIPNANYWVLRPDSMQHDLRTVLSGLGLRGNIFSSYFSHRAKDAESAVSRVLLFLQLFHPDISGDQSLDHFNVMLAPYFDKLSVDELKRLSKHLIIGMRNISNFGLNPSHSISIVLDPHVPEVLRGVPAIGVSESTKGTYEEYEHVAADLFASIAEVLTQGDDGKLPYLSPIPFARVCTKCFSENDSLTKLHQLSASWGTPFFINQEPEWQTESVNYDGNLVRLDSDWKGEWDLDTLRTGNLDRVHINLPRIAYESKGDDNLFFEKLEDVLETCKIALDTKKQLIESRMFKDGVLTMLSQTADSEQYYRIQNSTKAISYLGLPESSKFHTSASTDEWRDVVRFSTRILKHIRAYVDTLSKSSSERWVVSQAPFDTYSIRLARLDIDRFGREDLGLGKANEPYYSADNALWKSPAHTLSEVLKTESEFHQILNGGHLLTMFLPGAEVRAERILEITKMIVEDSRLGLYSFARRMTHCSSCQINHFGIVQKCTKCGSSGGQLFGYDRVSGPQRQVEPASLTQRGRVPQGFTLDVSQVT